MCGFAGIIGESNLPDRLIDTVSEAIAHRGPDGRGEWIENDICLIHRRLSVQDIEGGSQPMISVGGRHVVVYNGEIYNFPVLKSELEGEGVVFRTHCDTEVLLHVYAKYGAKMVNNLRGMFAFAIWDRSTQEPPWYPSPEST